MNVRWLAVLVAVGAAAGCKPPPPPAPPPKAPAPAPPPPAPEPAPAPKVHDPKAFEPVLSYILGVFDGKPKDDAFEARDVQFDTLDLAELVMGLCRQRKLSTDKAVEFMGLGTKGDLPEGTLARRIIELSATKNAVERAEILTKETTLVRPMRVLKTVEDLLKYCRAVEGWCKQ